MKVPSSNSRPGITPLVVGLALALAVAAPATAAAPARANALLRFADRIGGGSGALARASSPWEPARRGRAMPKSDTGSRPATPLPVTSCADDGGLGTLRHVVLTAVSGDTVDLSALT